MRSRGWVVVTVIVVLAVVFAGLGVALFAGGGTPAPDPTSRPTPTAGSTLQPGQAALFELRQVLFQETGKVQRKPPLPPGPADGGRDATNELLRVDCELPARPSTAADNVIACDSFGFRYGLGPSELPPGSVADAIALQTAVDEWVVQVTLTDEAASSFADLTKRVSVLGPPLNQLAIVLNGAVVSAPAVQETIKGGTLQITGDFTQGEAEALASALG